MSDSVSVFNTTPAASITDESPLVWSFQQNGIPQPGVNNNVTLRERAGLGHLTLRGGAIALDKALRAALGMSLPAQPLSLTQNASGAYSAQWLSPDEWLLIVPPGEAFSVETRLRAEMGDEHYAITDISGGQTLLELRGEAVRLLLQKSVICDVHPQAFPTGKGVVTCFARASVNLRRPDEDCWQLVVRRSFADYSYRWLLDAGAEYGLAVLR
ncbi:sarcosine oxidase subunit gamma [Escherichia coli]|nr:sarcosine oxidase subunit gamma [Escherichia coli]EIX9599915.1 sarcosine oxidase subunit gamma [Klebsiella pneumoniae]HBW6184042.1 sarcosine oxidase subunit gamma [Klebsiella pneumoniae]